MLENRENIEDYLLGKLDGEALYSFEGEMENNEEFRLEVDEFRLIYGLLRQAKVQTEVAEKVRIQEMALPPILPPRGSWVSHIRGWLVTLDFPSNQRRDGTPLILQRLALGIFLLAIVASGIFSYASLRYSNQALANRYFEAPEYPTQKGEENPISQADELIRQKKYDEAIEILNKIHDEQPIAELYLATIYFRKKEYGASLQALSNIDEEDKFQLSPLANARQVRWDSLMIQLAQTRTDDELDAVIKALQDQQQTKEDQLLKDLSSPWRKLIFWE